MSDHYISIKTSTWHRESHGLYDYESTNVTTKKLKITSESIIMQTSDKILSLPLTYDYHPTSETKFLCSFTRNGNNFSIQPLKGSDQIKGLTYENTWLVIKNLKNSHGYSLSEGDTIRLGKVKLKIKEIKGLKKPKVHRSSIQSKNVFMGGIGSRVKSKNTEEEPLEVPIISLNHEVYPCRICLNEEKSDDNPLIAPCSCAGSMGLVHVECLQQWLGSKVATREFNNSTSYSWKSLECELCKFKYPDQIQISSRTYSLLTVKKPDSNYIIFESISSEPSQSKVISVISFQDKKNIRLGRGQDSDIRLSDISVSRNHANIRVSSSGLFLEDNSSKFGTLVKIKAAIILNYGSKFSVQCGRTQLQLTVKKPFSLFGCLSRCNKNHDSDDEINRPARDITEESIQQLDRSN